MQILHHGTGEYQYLYFHTRHASTRVYLLLSMPIGPIGFQRTCASCYRTIRLPLDCKILLQVVQSDWWKEQCVAALIYNFIFGKRTINTVHWYVERAPGIVESNAMHFMDVWNAPLRLRNPKQVCVECIQALSEIMQIFVKGFPV